ncbi:MAG: DUF1501 domain-containing protein [Isosphaeraceae bacterium]
MNLPNGASIDRRRFLALAGAGASMAWLTPVGRILARRAERARSRAQSVICLWLGGGPSQLETFDPKPGSKIAGGTGAIDTAAKGIQLADGFEQLADSMDRVALVRSLVSLEGDHERGVYLMKTGYRMDPNIEYPSIGAICCHELPAGSTDIPRHISIMTPQWAGRGGFFGGEYDAFQVDDPRGKLRDMAALVPEGRDRARAGDLDLLERTFARGRKARVDATLHRDTLARARTMMTSEQLKAFDVSEEPEAVRLEYGDTPFGRGCLAARRLIEVGVRCVEVTLSGWDTHVNNHEICRGLVKALDPAFAALLRDLERRDLLDSTVVFCGGEFGRTPKINLAGGRDHWPNGFSMALAGGGIRGGLALGETDPEGVKPPDKPQKIEDLHATILGALGIDPAREEIDPRTSRPIKLSSGKAIPELLMG